MRKRSKYRPKGVLLNPMKYVLEGFTPMNDHGPHLVDLQLKNHASVMALLEGRATASHMGAIIAMYNITEALHKMGFGADYGAEVAAGRAALISIVHRSHKVNKYVPTGPEITAINALVELHDAQLDIVTVREMDQAIQLARKEVESGRATNLRNPP